MDQQHAPIRLGLIWAEAEGRAIGRRGELPWHLPEDLRHFKETTLGSPVIMGRLTWESLPERFRPLPGRTNVVISRNPNFSPDGAIVVTGLTDALAAVADLPEVRDGADRQSDGPTETSDVDAWLIGGGGLFTEALPHSSVASVTRIVLEVQDADTFAPELDDSWVQTAQGDLRESVTGLFFRTHRFERKST